MYEYVPKTEYAPVRKELEEIIRKAQVFLRQKYKITFQYHLIGSGKRHLIMRDTSGNKGYDFDYNLILPYKPEQKPKQLNEYFRLAFNFAVKGTAYKCPEDSTTVLTIKVVDPKHKKIAHSCDFAIIYYPYENTDDGYFYLKNWKDGKYTFEFRQLSEGAERKLAELKEYSDWWSRIKGEYKKLKNNNKQKSVLLSCTLKAFTMSITTSNKKTNVIIIAITVSLYLIHFLDEYVLCTGAGSPAPFCCHIHFSSSVAWASSPLTTETSRAGAARSSSFQNSGR